MKYYQNDILNSEITLDEVLEVSNPNEIKLWALMTNEVVCVMSYIVCTKCVLTMVLSHLCGMVQLSNPSRKDDPRVPLNYRGISLISAV